MKVTIVSRDSLVQACQLVASVPFDRSTGSVVYTLHCVAKLSSSPLLWPALDAAAVEIAEKRREFSQQLERYFHDMRGRARESCPLALLLCFEEQLLEIEATLRATVTGRLSPFADLSYHIRQVEDFGRRLQAIHTGHRNIGDDDVGVEHVSGCQERGTVRDCGHHVELGFEDRPQLLGNVSMIVGQQHTSALHRTLLINDQLSHAGMMGRPRQFCLTRSSKSTTRPRVAS